jgi:hypothetical protein
MSTSVRVVLFAQRPVDGPIDFDVVLSGAKVEGRILRADPEWDAADEAIRTHVYEMTFAGPTAPGLELPVERVRELVARRWK